MNYKMKTFLASILILFSTLSSYAWDLQEMNRTIDTTNFIVDGRCSGTLIDLEQRLILTNWHCIKHKIKTTTSNETDSNGIVTEVKREELLPLPVIQNSYNEYEHVGSVQYMTEIILQSEDLDLALIQIKAKSIPHTFASQILPDGLDVIRGERVYIVGNPAMFDASIVEGIVSNTNRLLRVEGTERHYIQVSGGITGGNSGGALYNNNGQFIGIPAAVVRGREFLGFVIPIWEIRNWLRINCYASTFDHTANDSQCTLDLKEEENNN